MVQGMGVLTVSMCPKRALSFMSRLKAGKILVYYQWKIILVSRPLKVRMAVWMCQTAARHTPFNLPSPSPASCATAWAGKC